METKRKDIMSDKRSNFKNPVRVVIKKVLLGIAIVTITSGAIAQSKVPDSSNKNQYQKNKTTQNQTQQQYPGGQEHPDGYMFQKGKMMQIKNGKMTLLDKDVTLSNATVITRNGHYTKKGGINTPFKEGEHMDMMGNMIPMDNLKDYNQKASGSSVHDTTYNKPRK